MASQTAISKAVCYKTKNEQLWEKAVHFLLVAINCFYAGLPTVFCAITKIDRFTAGYEKEKEEKPFDFSSVVSGCGGRDSNSHRITPTTPSK